MDAKSEFEHGAGWYAETAVAPRRWPVADLRSRRRCLRRRRRPCGPDGRARNRSPRLVGGAAGSASDRMECVGPQYRLRGSGLCAGCRRASSSAAASTTPRNSGRCRKAASNMSRNLIRDTGMPGVDPVDGWLDVSKVDRGDELLAFDQPARPGIRRRRRRLADRKGARRPQERSLFPRHPFSDARFTSIRSTTRSALPRRRKRLACASSRRRRRSRSIRPACESAFRRRARGVRASTSCSPATRTSADLLRSWRKLCCRFRPMSRSPSRLASVCETPSTYRGGVSDTRLADNHYRIVGGDRLMWSGGSTTLGSRSAATGQSRSSAPSRSIYPQLGDGRDCARVVRHHRLRGAPHAADR